MTRGCRVPYVAYSASARVAEPRLRSRRETPVRAYCTVQIKRHSRSASEVASEKRELHRLYLWQRLGPPSSGLGRSSSQSRALLSAPQSRVQRTCASMLMLSTTRYLSATCPRAQLYAKRVVDCFRRLSARSRRRSRHLWQPRRACCFQRPRRRILLSYRPGAAARFAARVAWTGRRQRDPCGSAGKSGGSGAGSSCDERTSATAEPGAVGAGTRPRPQLQRGGSWRRRPLRAVRRPSCGNGRRLGGRVSAVRRGTAPAAQQRLPSDVPGWTAAISHIALRRQAPRCGSTRITRGAQRHGARRRRRTRRAGRGRDREGPLARPQVSTGPHPLHQRGRAARAQIASTSTSPSESSDASSNSKPPSSPSPGPDTSLMTVDSGSSPTLLSARASSAEYLRITSPLSSW